MKAVATILLCIGLGPVVAGAAGFVYGGLTRMAPCHSAPDFLSGAIFGGFAFTCFFGLPLAAVGTVVGTIVAVFRFR